MKVSIIILNWNGGAEDCIESALSADIQSYANKEVIFVDNGSTDDSCEAVKARFPNFTYVELEENIGCPPGRNVGAEHACGDLLFFLENDGAWDDSGLVSSAVSLFDRQPQLGAVYTRVEGYETGSTDAPLDPQPARSTAHGLYLSSSFRGGASIIRAKLFTDCGGFPKDFFRQGEERFLSLLIYDRDYKVAYWPDYTLRHKGSDYEAKAALVSSFNVENDLKTILRLYPLFPAVAIGIPKWFAGTFSLLKAGLYRESVAITLGLIKELFGPTRYARIRKSSFCEVEGLRQGIVPSLDVAGCCDKIPMSVLVFKRLLASML